MSALAENPTLDIVALVRQGAEIEVVIPDDITSERLLDGLFKFGSQIRRLDEYRAVLQYGIGRMMTMAARRADFLDTAGFKTFGDFESHLIDTTGMKRSTLWRWKPIYEALPALSRQQLENIPAASLYLIAQNAHERVREEALAIAPTMTVDKLKRHAEDEGWLGAPAEGGANFVLGGPKEKIREFRDFVENSDVQTHVGSSSPLDVALAAIHETQSSEEWPKV